MTTQTLASRICTVISTRKQASASEIACTLMVKKDVILAEIAKLNAEKGLFYCTTTEDGREVYGFRRRKVVPVVKAQPAYKLVNTKSGRAIRAGSYDECAARAKDCWSLIEKGILALVSTATNQVVSIL